MKKIGTLFVVALPIGNAKDITLRAIEVLSQVDLVAAEDTRTFNELARELKLKISKVVAHHDHNEAESTKGLIELLNDGKNIAIVSDAGTPGISDPGFRLVKEAFSEGIRVVPLPGASSLSTALSANPIGGKTSLFAGFLSANTRKKDLQDLRDKADRLVLFEAPHRLLDLLRDALDVLGNTEVYIARELTKTYEELNWGTLIEIIAHYQENSPKGEFVVTFGRPVSLPDDGKKIEENIKDLLEQGRTPSDIVKELQDQTSLKKKQLYNLVLKLKS